MRDRKNDEFMALKKGNMIVTTYEARFNALFHYITQLVKYDYDYL